EREGPEGYHTCRGAIRKVQVSHFNQAVIRFDNVGLDLGLKARATAYQHPLEPILWRDFQIDRQLFDKFYRVVYGVASPLSADQAKAANRAAISNGFISSPCPAHEIRMYRETRDSRALSVEAGSQTPCRRKRPFAKAP